MKWIDPKPVEPAKPFREAIEGHPLVSKTLLRRGYSALADAQAFLDPQAYSPTPPSALPDLEKAVGRLLTALERGERVLVWGDFDVDGQTSTTLLVEALREAGGDVTYYIPDRKTESHGVHLPKLKTFLKSGMDLLLTCDTGIDAFDAAAYAQSQGVDVLITDHHDLPPTLPEAHAVVNSNRVPDTHPLASLPGVGVAYKVIQALYRRLGNPSDHYLDLVALGIVADIATQTKDTRYLLQKGLAVLQQSRRPLLQALFEMNDLNPLRVNEEHIGYIIGPRLNALGRLENANPVVEHLMIGVEADKAQRFAFKLDHLNHKRQALTEEIFKAAQTQIEKNPDLLEDYQALVLLDENWHPGVIGIVASRLVDQYHKPTILLTKTGPQAHGSARSLNGVHITEAITAQSDILDGFGGHPMAAGVRLPLENVPAFRRGLSEYITRTYGETLPEPTLVIDGYLPFSDLTLAFVQDLDRLAPFGPGNPALVLATRDVKIAAETLVGRDRNHRKLLLEDPEGTQQEVLWWHSADQDLPEAPFDLAYRVKATTFQGEKQVQVTWVDSRVRETPSLTTEPEPEREIVDLRATPQPQKALREIQDTHPDLFVWAEGKVDGDIPGEPRSQARPAAALAIWTAPPDRQTLQSILKQVDPGAVYFLCQTPEPSSEKAFRAHFMGLIKFTLLEKNGAASLTRLAEVTAARPNTIIQALNWLEARGEIRIRSRTEDHYQLTKGAGVTSERLPEAEKKLRNELQEIFAYRKHVQEAKVDNLL